MVEELIRRELARLEKDQRVRVLFACESGSRAWGFASPDSDYDVRFIYLSPLDRYLSIEESRDVIDEMLPEMIDVSGWDLRKTLGLLRKSNPSLIEWLHSPIVYREDSEFMVAFRALSEEYISLPRLYRHYVSMAKSNFDSYLQGDWVARKKYLYVLRPVLCCRWIESEGTVPPVPFGQLKNLLYTDVEVEPELREALEKLLREKRDGDELSLSPKIPILHEFLRGEIVRMRSTELEGNDVPPVEPLDDFFRTWARKG